ncbi:MAG: acyltransferase [Proteobacteria bacterium]|nr:acyltransferase [Pseudomonadota bacterium]
MKLHRFVVLDGLRGAAAAVVLCLHLAQQHDVAALPLAAQAVDFFYMLSGFVIAFAYEERLKGASMSFMGFAWLRIVRLYPLVFLATVAGMLLGVLAVWRGSITSHQLLEATALGLLLLPSFVFPQWETAYPLNLASWSLTFELFANAAYAVAVRFLTTRRLIVLIAASVALLVWVSYENQGIGGGNNQNNFLFGFGRVMFPFFAGVLIYRVRAHIPTVSFGGVAVLVALPLLLLAPVNSAVASLLYVLLLFPMIVAVGSTAVVPPQLASWCRFSGMLSYPLYILQGPILRIGEELLKHMHLNPIEAYVFAAGEAAVVVMVSLAAVHVFDNPLQSYFRRHGPQTDRRQAAPAFGA